MNDFEDINFMPNPDFKIRIMASDRRKSKHDPATYMLCFTTSKYVEKKKLIYKLVQILHLISNNFT